MRAIGLSSALYLQQFGRAASRRTVHARRARTLRKRGEMVHFSHYNDNGKAVYKWTGLRRGVVLDLYSGDLGVPHVDEAHIIDPPGRWALGFKLSPANNTSPTTVAA